MNIHEIHSTFRYFGVSSKILKKRVFHSGRMKNLFSKFWTKPQENVLNFGGTPNPQSHKSVNFLGGIGFWLFFCFLFGGGQIELTSYFFYNVCQDCLKMDTNWQLMAKSVVRVVWKCSNDNCRWCSNCWPIFELFNTFLITFRPNIGNLNTFEYVLTNFHVFVSTLWSLCVHVFIAIAV